MSVDGGDVLATEEIYLINRKGSGSARHLELWNGSTTSHYYSW